MIPCVQLPELVLQNLFLSFELQIWISICLLYVLKVLPIHYAQEGINFLPQVSSSFSFLLYLKFRDCAFPWLTQSRSGVVISLTSCIHLVRNHVHFPSQDFLTHSLCAIPMDNALVQNFIISTLLFELFPETLMAMSFPTWSAQQSCMRMLAYQFSAKSKRTQSLRVRQDSHLRMFYKSYYCKILLKVQYILDMEVLLTWFSHDLIVLVKAINMLEGIPSGPFLLIMNFLRATFKIKVRTQRHHLPYGTS